MINSVEAFVEQIRGIANSAGRAAIHSMMPNNYEYYLCTLELYDFSQNLKGMMSFMVMPNSISETETALASVHKTNNAIFTTYNTSFAPKDISIQGTFGRKIRLILDQKEVGKMGKDLGYGNIGVETDNKNPIMIKTGYGLTKMLEKMIKAVYMKDSNDSGHFLVFTNYALNHSYIVEPLQSSFSQSVENNMIWYYSLEFRAVAPADLLSSSKNFFSSAGAGIVASSVRGLLSGIKKDLRLTDFLSGLKL